MTKDNALQMCLEYIETDAHERKYVRHAIKAALETKDEPVAWMVWGHDNVPSLTFTKPADKYVFDSLYMTPPQRTWVGLTDEEIEQAYMETMNFQKMGRILEAKLKEKNS